MRAQIQLTREKWILALLLISGLALSYIGVETARQFSRPHPDTQLEILGTVSHALWPDNGLGIGADQLRAEANPHGVGTFVYVDPAAVPPGVQQPPIWLVIDGQAFRFLGARELTPSLPSVLDGPPDLWRRIGYDPPNYAVRFLFERY